jgi:hypothetical protein
MIVQYGLRVRTHLRGAVRFPFDRLEDQFPRDSVRIVPTVQFIGDNAAFDLNIARRCNHYLQDIRLETHAHFIQRNALSMST